MSDYAAQELREQLERGPYAGEDFFRLNVTGNGRTNWVNVTSTELAAIIAVVTPGRDVASGENIYTFTHEQATLHIADALVDADEDLRAAVALLLAVHAPEAPIRSSFPELES